MGGLFLLLAPTLLVSRFVTLIPLVPFSLTVLGVVRVLALLGFLVLMAVLVLLLALLVLVHRRTPSTPIDDWGSKIIAGKVYRSRVLKPVAEHRRNESNEIAQRGISSARGFFLPASY